MNKYQVYLTNGGIINIEADDFSANYECGVVRFASDNYGETIAVFALSNIFGFEKVDEFEDEEDDE